MKNPSSLSGEAVALGARLILGALFLHLGAVKALDPAGFLKLVRQFDLLPSPFPLNAVAGLLPWFEIFCGLLLLAGIRTRGAAVVTAIMLLVFTILLLLRALAIAGAHHLPFCAVRFDCGCGTGEVWICAKLTENAAATLLAGMLAVRGSRRACLWPDPA